MASRTLRGVIRGEEGQSLVVALILMSALTISIAGVITFMGSNEASTGRDRQVVRAVDVAEAGLSNAMSVIATNDPTNDTVNKTHYGPYTTNMDGGTVTYSMHKSQQTDPSTSPPTNYWVWTITSTGKSQGVTRMLSQQVKFIPGVLIDESAIYKYGLFVGDPPAGTNPACLITLHGNVTVSANVYVGGNLCTQGGVSLTPKLAHTLSVYVKGYVNANGSGTIGTSGLPFAQAIIVGGCSASNFVICSNKTNVWADSYTGTFTTLQKPTVDAAATYNKATSWVNKCTGAGFQLDTTAGIGQTMSQQDLFPSQSYTCTVPMVDGSTSTLSWNASTNTLTIIGTIFIDGDIQMASDAKWVGDGSIYVNGVVTKKSNKDVCGPPKAGSGPTGYGCSTTWDTTSISLLGTTTSGSTTVSGLSSTVGLAAGMYVDGPGIVVGTKIASITNSTTIVLTQAATATAGPTLTFSNGNFGIVVLNPTNAAVALDSGGNGELDMDVYLVQGVNNTGGTVITGSVITDGGDIGGGTGVLNNNNPPPGFPIFYQSPAVGWTQAPLSWKQLK